MASGSEVKNDELFQFFQHGVNGLVAVFHVDLVSKQELGHVIRVVRVQIFQKHRAVTMMRVQVNILDGYINDDDGCWTKSVGDIFQMLVTVFIVFVINKLYFNISVGLRSARVLTLVGHQHPKNAINIELFKSLQYLC